MKLKRCFQLINACICKEETAFFPEVGVYHSVCYVLIGLRQGWRTDVRPTVVLLGNISIAQYLWHYAHVHPGM